MTTSSAGAQARLLLLVAVLFLSYLCVAIPLPVVPVQVTDGLGLGNLQAGLAVGIAFLATILTRGPAGRISDRAGAKIEADIMLDGKAQKLEATGTGPIDAYLNGLAELLSMRLGVNTYHEHAVGQGANAEAAARATAAPMGQARLVGW